MQILITLTLKQACHMTNIHCFKQAHQMIIILQNPTTLFINLIFERNNNPYQKKEHHYGLQKC